MTALSGLGEPLGALLAVAALGPVVPPSVGGALAAGAMIVLAAIELIPEAFSHSYVGEAAVGLLAGIFLGTRGGRIVFTPPRSPRLPRPTNGPVTPQEIRNSPARTLSELLHELRPQWVRAEGTQILLPNGAVTAARGGVQVYLNGALIGGLQALDKVSIDAVTGIQFLSGQTAALRYGANAEDGAILLTATVGP